MFSVCVVAVPSFYILLHLFLQLTRRIGGYNINVLETKSSDKIKKVSHGVFYVTLQTLPLLNVNFTQIPYLV